jgi:sugar-specific transcriptional regulator TrmB
MLEEGRTSESELGGILETLGLSSLEARTYLELARGGSLSASETAKKSKIARPEAYEVLRKLEGKGFVRQVLGKPARYEPVDPLELRNRILQEERKRFNSIEAGMSKILEVWPFLRAMHMPESHLPRTATLRGRKNIAAVLEGMMSSAQESVNMCTTKRGLLTAMQENFPEIGKRLIDRGVEVRMLIDESSAKQLTSSLVPDAIDMRISKGPKARYYIIDDHEVLYHLHLQAEEDLWGSDETALRTDSPDQLNVYGWLFKNAWDNGTPLKRAQVLPRRVQHKGGS